MQSRYSARTQRLFSLRRLEIVSIGIAPIVYAAIALLLGKKTGWDLYNYHWYNPYAWLHNRLGQDVAVAHHATYYNPLSDVPLYWLATHGPSWLGGAFMGAMTGIAVALIGVVVHRALPGNTSVSRTLFIALLAMLSTIGAGAFQEIGDPANDIPAAIGIFAALCLLLPWLASSQEVRAARWWRTPFVAGVFAGAAVALKLTIAVYAVGIAGAFLFCSGSWRRRVFSMSICGLGAAIGLLAVGGAWMYEMWRFSGNPLFPYFNDLFRSPLLLAESYRDLNFRPKDGISALIYPWQFTLESRTVSESVFRDARILILYALLPFALLARRFLRTAGERTPLPDTTRFLFAFAAISYCAWLAIFGIYRYLIPLEMLAPLLIALALSTLHLRPALKMIGTVGILAAAQILVRVDLSDRQSWTGPYVGVSVPPLSAPRKTMILMAGHAPMAYVIPYFPPNIPFVRIDSWLVGGDDSIGGLAQQMHRRVDAHDGPLLMLFDDEETELAVDSARHYGLRIRLDSNGCNAVRSNINTPLWLCETTRP